MQTIKITSTGKGIHHWEDTLLENQRKRLALLMQQLEVPPFKKRAVNTLFKKRVTRDNIIALHSHPIKIFLLALLDNNLESLMHHTSMHAK